MKALIDYMDEIVSNQSDQIDTDSQPVILLNQAKIVSNQASIDDTMAEILLQIAKSSTTTE